MKFLYAVFLLIILSSCKILHSPRIKTDGYITGVCLNKKNPCLKTDKFIIIHGIGPQKNDYSEKMIRHLNDNKFGKNNYTNKVEVIRNYVFEAVENKSVKEVCDNYYNNGDIQVLKITSTPLYNPESIQNVYYSINWAVCSIDVKEKLSEDEFKNSPFYFGVNKKLKKEVMINRVGDAFNGSKPEIIKKLRGTVLSIFENGKFVEDTTFNLISGSFGTQMFLGALHDLQQVDSLKKTLKMNDSLDKRFNELYNEKAFESIVKISESNTLNIYALTNQVNLMPDNVKGWFGHKYSQDGSKLNFGRVNIVAFRNPNDILCYYLPIDVAKDFFNVPTTSVNVVNTYYFNWPFKNDIARAHTSVFDSKKLAKVIHYGSASNWVRRDTNKLVRRKYR